MEETFEVRDARNGEWHWVYNAVLADPHISSADKLIYGAISTFGGCEEIRPSFRTIGERAGLSERTAKGSVKKLEEVGYIKVESGGGRHQTNRYWMVKRPKGCRFCTVSKQCKPEQETVQTTTENGAGISPQVDKEVYNKQDKPLATTSVATIPLKKELLPPGPNRPVEEQLIYLFKDVNPSVERLFPNKNQRSAITRLVEKNGRERIEWAIKALAKTNKMKYAPTITTPTELENKLGSLIAFLSKQKGQEDKYKVGIV